MTPFEELIKEMASDKQFTIAEMQDRLKRLKYFYEQFLANPDNPVEELELMKREIDELEKVVARAHLAEAKADAADARVAETEARMSVMMDKLLNSGTDGEIGN
jgi:phage terminase Nu1 subunit (DNA packaging protein)